jgi:hypothetical protein
VVICGSRPALSRAERRRHCPRRVAGHRYFAHTQRHQWRCVVRQHRSARVGISGFSAGAASAIGAAGGLAAIGVVADPRIKAMVVYEPALLSLADASTSAVPYLVMGGQRVGSRSSTPRISRTCAHAELQSEV